MSRTLGEYLPQRSADLDLRPPGSGELNPPSYNNPRTRAVVEGASFGTAPMPQGEAAESGPTSLRGHIKARRSAREAATHKRVPPRFRGRNSD